jgi:hypothetical protein
MNSRRKTTNMKTNRITALPRLTIVIALLVTNAGIVAAGETSTAKGGATRLIHLHAPNNATPSVTVWIPKKATRSSGEVATAKGGATKLVYLHAPNNATPSVTVWTGK